MIPAGGHCSQNTVQTTKNRGREGERGREGQGGGGREGRWLSGSEALAKQEPKQLMENNKYSFKEGEALKFFYFLFTVILTSCHC